MTLSDIAIRNETTMSVHSHFNDRWFTVRLLRPGDKYGLNRCLTWGEANQRGESRSPFEGQPGVEFYDATYASDPRFDIGMGQFTGGRYYVSSLLEQDAGGLDLMTYEDAWKIDAPAMDLVRTWMRNVTWAA